MRGISRRSFFRKSAWVPSVLVASKFLPFGTAGASAFAAPRPAAREAKNPQFRELSDLARVRFGGKLDARYQASTVNVLSRPDRYSLETFRSSALGVPGALWWDWPGDQIGRYLSVLHAAQALGWASANTQREAVLDIVLPLQQPQGNFGPATPDFTDLRVISGNAFALRGLMDTYEDTRDQRSLQAARRLAKFFAAHFDYYKDRGREGAVHEFYGHCLDGLVRLHELGGDQDALDLAQRIGKRAGLTAHAHHSLSLYRGEINLYRLTGDEDYLKRTVAFLDWLRSLRSVSGGLPENLPHYHEDEGCALSDYVVVSLKAFAATGHEEFLEEAENTMVNHFFMNQFHTGGFGHRAYAEQVIGGKDWQGWGRKFGSENPGCCSFWGQRGLAEIGRYILTRHGGDVIEVNLYPAAEVSIPEVGARFTMESDFPRMRKASLKIDRTSRQAFELRLRVPRWAEGATVTVNGAGTSARREGSRLVLRRNWNSGDVVGIEFQSSLRLAPWQQSQAGSPMAGVFDGPLCLALSTAQGDVSAESTVATTAKGKPAVNAQGQPVVLDKQGRQVALLRPLEQDWMSPDVYTPNQLRILFKTKTINS